MTSQYLHIENHHFLIDCGEATQFQLARQDVNTHKIDRIFISHLHGDHFFGLPGLLSTMHLNRRTTDLHIHGPRGLEEVLLANFRHTQTVLNYRVFIYENHPHFPEVIFEDDTLSVETVPLRHRVPCTGFLFREKPKQRRIIPEKLPAGIPFELFRKLKAGDDIMFEGEFIRNEDVTLPPRCHRSYAFCSDTIYHPQVVSQIFGIDLLYHEATFAQAQQDRAEATFHSTTEQAADIAQQAQVGKLLIGHFSGRYRDLQPLLQEARQVFPNTELALEGMRFEILC